jgi:hypothetical protein
LRIKQFLTLILLFSLSTAKEITPNEVYAEVMQITDEIHEILKYFDVEHDHEGIIKRNELNLKLEPRNVWQKSYEVMVKINILRDRHNMPIVEPVNIAPLKNLNPDLVYEQTQRILAELHIFKTRVGIADHEHKKYSFKSKTPLDVYNAIGHVSASFDELNGGGVTPSFVFGENMRVYDDITMIIEHLDIEDKTIPAKKNISATPTDTFEVGMKTLEKIKQLQISVGINFVDFSDFQKEESTPSEVFGITQMIIAELQTLKAYLGISTITPAAKQYDNKTPSEVHQLMSWNLRKLELIKSLNRIK